MADLKQTPPKPPPVEAVPAGFFRGARGQLVPEAYRGPKSYRLKQPRYVAGQRMYEAGEVITVTDEVPSRTWEPMEAHHPVAKPAAAEKSPRASDTTI